MLGTHLLRQQHVFEDIFRPDRGANQTLARTIPEFPCRLQDARLMIMIPRVYLRVLQDTF